MLLVRINIMLVSIVLVMALAASVISVGQLYYGVANGCGKIVIVGSASNTGLIIASGNSSTASIKISNVAVLNSVAIGKCMAVAVGLSSSGQPVYVTYNLTNGELKVYELGGLGELYGVAYGNGYFAAVGYVNDSGLMLLISGNGGYSVVRLPSDFKVLYGVSFGDGGFLIVGEGSRGAVAGFYNLSNSLITDYSSSLPSSYNYALYSASYGYLGFMVVGEGLTNSSEYPIVGLLNVTSGSFRDLSGLFTQYSVIIGVSYIDYTYLLVGSAASGSGGYGYYSLYGINALYSTVQSNNPYFPLILYSATPLSPGLFYVVGNNGVSSMAIKASVPVIYNVTFMTNVGNSVILLRGPVSTYIRANSTIPLPQGVYNITVQAPGYYNETEIMYVNSNSVFNVRLSPIRYCSLELSLHINGTNESIPAAAVSLASSWPNENHYLALTNESGQVSLKVICNSYILSVNAQNFINRTLAVNVNSSELLNINLTPVVHVYIKAPTIEGKYIVIMSGVENGTMAINSSGSYNFTIYVVGMLNAVMFRLINSTTQYLGNLTIQLHPGINIINVTWLTPVIKGIYLRQLVPGNVSVLIQVNLSKVGNVVAYLRHNSSVKLLVNYTGINSTVFELNFTTNGVYYVCVYTWSALNGSIFIDYGPTCLPINVVLHSELIVIDESSMASRFTGYYLGNATLTVSLPRVITLSNGTRLIYNGSIFNGEYISNNTFNIRLSRIVNYLRVLWVREYLVKVSMLVNGKLLNSTQMWIREYSIVKYPQVVYFNNGTRLVNESNVVVNITGPVNISISYYRQFNVTVMEFSRLGIINEYWLWVNEDAQYRPEISIIMFNNGTRLLPRLVNESVTIIEPTVINITFTIQYLVTIMKSSSLGVFNTTRLWINESNVIRVINTIVQFSNLTRLIPIRHVDLINVTMPMVVNEPYVVQYALINNTMIGNVTWLSSIMWVNNSSTVALNFAGTVNLGNNTRLILEGVYVNGKPTEAKSLIEVNGPLIINATYYRQWFIKINAYTLNDTPLMVSSMWVNSSGIITNVKWGNLTVALSQPLAINESVIRQQPIPIKVNVSYRVFKVLDKMGLPSPDAHVVVICGNYSVVSLSNAMGIVKVLIPAGIKCVAEAQPIGYYTASILIIIALIVSVIVIKIIRKHH